MSEQGWVVAAVVLVAGLLSGLALAAITRRREGEAVGARSGREARLAELEARRAQLMEQLRLAGIEAASADERAALERDTARVLRELDALAAEERASVPTGTPSASAPAASAPAASAPAAPAPAARPAAARSGGLSPQLAGALKGGAVVAIAFVLYLTLSNQTNPRAPGMSVTGNDAVAPMAPAATSSGAGPAMASPGMGGDGQPAGSLAPHETALLVAAREQVAANPSSHAAKVQLGWALVDAGGWIEVYHLADDLLTENESDPDGLALAVAVRVAMGQREGLTPLVDQALDAFPEHPMLLAWRGRLAQLTGDAKGAEGFFARAQAKGSDEAAVTGLIAAFRRTPAPTSRHPGPGAAPQRPSPASAAEAGFEGGVSGTVKLAEGVTAPPGAVLFLIARRPGGNGGPPAAVRKIPGPTFPRAFTLGPADAMMGGPFPETVTVQARLDTDGNPMTRSPSDLVAAWPEEAHPGQRGIVLELAPGR